MSSKPDSQPYQSKIRLFENPFLERLTHVHPATPAIVWIPVVIALIYKAIRMYHPNPAFFAFHAIAGLFIWSISEYILHRFIFHFEFESKFGKRIHFLIHGNHHDDPQDPTRLVMPPVAAIILAAGFYTFFAFLLPESSVDLFFAFFLVGYLAYDYTHFWVHHGKPKSEYAKSVKWHHMAHHYKNHDSRWGVSSYFWDKMFSTQGEKASASNTPSSSEPSSQS